MNKFHSAPKNNQLKNQNSFDDVFLNNLLSFMNDSDDSWNSSGYVSEVFCVSNVVTSGTSHSFCSKSGGDLIFRRCNFSNRLYASWTNSSAGLIPSIRESKPSHTITTPNKDSLLSNKRGEFTHFNQSVKDKTLFFTECLKNSLLPGLENHPIRLKRLKEDVESFHSQPKLIRTPTIPKVKGNSAFEKQLPLIEKSASSIHTKTKKICRFCLKNGEPEIVYTGHFLKGYDGTVTCPILRRYVCDLCGATGSYSHTRKYCPRYEEVLAQAKYRKLASGILAINLNHK